MKNDKTFIRTTLVADAQYLTLMGSPSAPSYNTFYLIPPKIPTFPEVVYWTTGGSLESLSTDFYTQNIGLTFAVWSKNTAYEDIAARIISVLHNKPLNEDFRIIFTGRGVERYDEETNAFGINLTADLIKRSTTNESNSS